jgi:hypothetical protein
MRHVVPLALLATLAFTAEPNKPPRVIRVPVLTNGEPLSAAGLKASVVNGGPATVVRVKSANDDLLLLTVLDLVGDLSRIDPARNALIEAVKALPPTTWVGVLKAQDGLQVLEDPTPDRGQFEKAVSALPMTGKAALLDSVEQAVALADGIAAKSPVRVALLYVTDSDVRNYREDFSNPVINSSDSRDLSRRFPEGLIREKISKITDKLAGFQTPVFIVHLTYSNERLDEAYQSGLLQISTTTGGSADFCRSLGDIPGAVSRMVASVQAHSQVSVQLPEKIRSVVSLALQTEDRPLTYRAHFRLRD